MVWSDPSPKKTYSYADTVKLALGQGLSQADAIQSAINWQNKGGKPIDEVGSAIYSPLNPSVPAPLPPAPAPYVPGAAPQQMDWETAFRKAQGRVNPTYDSLRGKAETTYSKARESIPQLLAARFGMSGLRGGRRQSAEYGATQNENQGISELEGQREQALNSTASAIQNDDFSTAMNLYNATEALKAKSARDAYQKWRDSILDQQAKQVNEENRLLKQLELKRQAEQFQQAQSNWEKQFGLQESQADLQTQQSDPNYWENVLKSRLMEAQINNYNKPSGGGSGGGLTSYQQYQMQQDQNQEEAKSAEAMDKWVSDKVANDSRLNPDYSNYSALYDAWKTMYVKNMYGG